MRAVTVRAKIRFALFLAFGLFIIGLAVQYGPRSAAFAGKPGPPPAKRGPATIVLQDSYQLPATFGTARPAGASRPTTLASTDFDIDGYPDLVSGYATPNGGYLVYQRGNPESFAPTRPENVEATGQSRFPVTFLPEAKTVELGVAPDFIVTGDFDRDTNPDVLAAARGGQEIYLASGDGDGGFMAARSIAVPGRITALAAGQIDLPDNLSDLAVGLEGESGAALLVYEGANGIADAPLRYALPVAAQSLSLGQLDDAPWTDVAILAGGNVSILHGRNQRDGFESRKRAAARLEHIPLPFAAQALALGEFIYDRDARAEIALLREDGTVAFATRGALDTRPLTTAEARELRRRQMFKEETPLAAKWQADATQPWAVAESLNVMEASAVRQAASGSAPALFNANLSGQMADDLVVLDAAAQQLKVFAVEAPPKVDGEFVSFAGPRAEMALPASGAPVAALSMRVSLHVRPGLVFLRAGGDAPEVMPSAPSATFTVTKGTDGNDGACNADCSLREAVVAANGAAGADMVTIPNNTYQLTIANAPNNEDNGANGDLDVNQDLTLNGTASATTIIQAGTTTANGIDKVFGLNPICAAAVSHSWNNVTVRFGRNTQANGAPDISFTGGGVDYCNTGAGTLSITNSVISDNTCANSFGGGLDISTLPTGVGAVTITNVTFNNNKTPTDSFDAKGGGIRGNGSGNLTITNSAISNNQTGTTPNIGSFALGGGIHLDQPTGAIMIQNSTISGNTAQRHGGGVAIDRPDGLATSAVTINQASVITGNTSNGGDSVGGGGQGGGIYANVNAAGTVTLTGLTITNNTAGSTGTPRGGGIASSLGGMNISFCRIFGNTASNGTGLFKTNGGGTVTATNNWWGCSGGPGTTGCQTAVLQAAPSVLTTTPFLQLRTTAATSPVVTGQTSALTASFLANSAGTAIAVGNLGALIGQTVTWSGVGGGISGAQTTIQAAGTATATYTATTVGAGSATAQVDGGPASGSTNTVAITVNKADTTASITSDSPDPSNVGQNVTVTYSVAVTSPGGGTPGGNVMVSDGVNSCTGTVAAGSCVVALATAGNRTLTATYQGDTNYNASAASAGAGHSVGQVTWTGATNTAFATNGNWNTGLTPGTGDTAIIPTGATNQPTVSGATSLASLSVAAGRTLTVNSTLTVSGTLTNNGTIMGTGTIANNFSNAGTLTPGLSPGVLNITGTFANTGAVNMEIGGTGGAGVNPNGHDQLVVSGAATLAGTLNVTLTNGFTPASLNEFKLLSTSALSGTFPTVNLPNIAPLVWNLRYITSGANQGVFLGVLGPTASGVNVGGYVLTQLGRAPKGAIVKLSDLNGQARRAKVDRFGHYQFDGVEAGQSYFVTVEAKGYNFTPATHVVTPNFDVEELNFTASSSR